MLSDRSYMRDDYQRERTSFLIWFLSATIAGFVIQQFCTHPGWLNWPAFLDYFALSVGGLRQGYVWTLFTYPLLHEGVLLLLVNVLTIFFLGRELINHVGEKRLAWLTAASAAGGALVWLAVHFMRNDMIVTGSTSILMCYLTVFACLFPNREISFLVFFVIPVRTRPKYIAWIVLFVALMGFLFSELPAARVPGELAGIPHSAHLGAMLVGWLYYRFVHEANWLALRRSSEIELPRWMKRSKRPAQTVNVTPESSSREDLRAEVDRILDKINSHGFGALTAEEKRKLDAAKDLLSRR